MGKCGRMMVVDCVYVFCVCALPPVRAQSSGKMLLTDAILKHMRKQVCFGGLQSPALTVIQPSL